jgi:phosphatidylserine/phosphatidylglycerophosphate/cardiolipin synthase-like enzyme
MTPQELEQMLRQTLADGKLSGGERNALTQVLAEAHLDAQKSAAYRAQAFDLAREALADPRAGVVLTWLEDVVKLLHPVRASSSSSASEVLFAPFDDLPARVVRLFQSAKRSANLCVFTITDDRLTSAILAAHRRGVRVRVISDNTKSSDLGADIDALSAAGIEVRLDRTDAHMHHKFAVFDDMILLNGSYNWTRSAANVNNENFVLSGERMLVDTFAKHFEKLWQMLG